MLKKINRVLKLVGLNLVHAKRRKMKWTGRLTISTAGPEIDSPLLPKCSDGKVKLSNYMGETEWQNTPPVAVPVSDENGGNCLLHCHSNASENTSIGYHTMAQVVSPNAAFVPVDIGVNDHEITRTEPSHEPKR